MKKFYLLLTVLMLTLTTVMSQTITTGAISTPICAGATISIPYTITGTFTAGNRFVAQLSNSAGAFTTPVLLDSVTSTVAGTITAQIPYGTAAGTAYKIQVIGRTPAITGTANATALTINTLPTISITSSVTTIINQVTTLAGTGTAGSTNGSASTATFSNPTATACDAFGNIYVAEYSGHKIRKISPDGVVSTFAGSGNAGFVDGIGTAASFNYPYGIVIDAAGNLYVGDQVNNRIRKITPAGVVSTFAGSGSRANTNGTGTGASFNYPQGLAIDAAGNIFVADLYNHSIRKITSAGVVSTLAGSGGQGSADGTGTGASFFYPSAVATDAAGTVVYVGDEYNNKVRKIITATGVVTTFAGSGTAGSTDGTGTGATFNQPSGVVTDAAGNLYVADATNNKIRKITPAGVVTTLAGSGTGTAVDGVGTAASLYRPTGINIDNAGNIYVADQFSNKIRKIIPQATVCNGGALTLTASGGSTYSWAGPQTITNGISFNATTIGLYKVTGTNAVGCASTNDIVVNLNLPTISITSSVTTIINQVTTLAGTGTAGSADGSASTATFSSPTATASDAFGNIYVAEYSGHKIRKISPAGVVSTFAGSGTAGFADGIGTAASFNYPYGIVIDAAGNLYVGDQVNNRIRKITPAGVVSTFAGSGSRANTNGTGTGASFNYPQGLAIDAAGNIFVADLYNHSIRKITSAGVVSTLAGNGLRGSNDGTGTQAFFNFPSGVSTDAAGTVVYVGDEYNNKVRKIITATGVVATLAGSGIAGSDDGTGTGATFNHPTGVVTDAAGNLYVADATNNKIRKITPAGVVTTLAGSGTGDAVDGVGTAASLYGPTGINIDNAGNIYVADQFSNKIRKIIPQATLNCGGALTLTASGGDNYSWTGPQTITNGVSFNATTSGLYKVTGTNAAGCASTNDIVVNLTTPPNISIISSATITPPKVTTISGVTYTDAFNGNATSYLTPTGVAADVSGNVFVADGNKNQIIKISSNGQVLSYAGTGSPSFVNGQRSVSTFNNPTGLALSSSGNLYVADRNNNAIRLVEPFGQLSISSTMAGNGTAGFVDGFNTNARFNGPTGIAVDATGYNFYVADQNNNSIRKMTGSQAQGGYNVTTLSGNGTAGFLDGNVSSALFNAPAGVAVDLAGNVFVSDKNNNRIRKITPAGVVSTFAGNGTAGSTDGIGTQATFNNPYGISVDALGYVYVADGFSNKIRKITPDGVVSTIAGNGTLGFLDGTGTSAQFKIPQGVAVDASGNVYVADRDNSRIRKITPQTTSVCTGGSITLTATGGSPSFSWSGPQTITNGTAFIPTSNGLYTVTNIGCNIKQAIAVSVNGIPNVSSGIKVKNATGTAFINYPLCSGNGIEQLTIDATVTPASNLSYQWFKGSPTGTNYALEATGPYTAQNTSALSIYNPQDTITGDFFVRVTSDAGCTANSAIKTVTVKPLPRVTISSTQNVGQLCNTSAVNTTFTANLSSGWSGVATPIFNWFKFLQTGTQTTSSIFGTTQSASISGDPVYSFYTCQVYVQPGDSNTCAVPTVAQCDVIRSNIENTSANSWTVKTDFASVNNAGVGFSIGNRGYIATGQMLTSVNGVPVNTNQLWEYNPFLNSWSQRANYPGGKINAGVGFSIGNKGYVGTGFNTVTNTTTNVFYEYDPTTNTWTQKANYPIQLSAYAVGFSLGSKGYIGTGFNYQNFTNISAFYEYNPATDSWTQKDNYGGGGVNSAVAFSIGSKAYVGTGTNGVDTKLFYEFNPSAATGSQWRQRPDFPGTGRSNAVGFSIDSKGYIGTGSGTADFYEYNASTNTWSTTTVIASAYACRNAVAFAIGNKGYLATGVTGNGFTSSLWEYSTNSGGGISSLIKTGAINNATAGATSFCSGSSITVPFTLGCVSSTSTYKAQLSDANGSFSNPIIIGNPLTSSANTGTITAVIPTNTVAGSGYRIRVICESPQIIGYMSDPITINSTDPGRIGTSHTVPYPWELTTDGITSITAASGTVAYSWEKTANNITLATGEIFPDTAITSTTAIWSTVSGISTSAFNLTKPNSIIIDSFYRRKATFSGCGVSAYSNVVAIKVFSKSSTAISGGNGRKNGTIRGKVVVADNPQVGVAGVTVSMKRITPVLGGVANKVFTATTDENGNYGADSLFYGDINNNDNPANFEITPSLTIGTTVHQFTVPGTNAAPPITVILSSAYPNTPNPTSTFNFNDNTTFSITGAVKQVCNNCGPLSNQTIIDSVSNVKMTLTSSVINPPRTQFTGTGATVEQPYGKYGFGVTIPASYTITPSYKGHTFTPSPLTTPPVNLNLPAQDFTDNTVRVISGIFCASNEVQDASGNIRKQYIGTGSLTFTDYVEGRNSKFTKVVPITFTSGDFATYSVTLPARKYKVSFTSFSPSITNTTAADYIASSELLSFFNSNILANKIIDIDSIDQKLDLYYHRKPTITFDNLNEICGTSTPNSSYVLFESGKTRTFTARVWEGPSTLTTSAGGTTTGFPVATDYVDPCSSNSFGFSVVPTNPSINATNGSILARVNGGSPSNYLYSKDGVNYGTDSLFNLLGAGNYIIYVKNAIGCVASKAVALSTICSESITINTILINPTPGRNDGQIIITAPSKTEYQFSVNNGQSYASFGTDTIKNLALGTYTLIAKSNGSGCLGVKQVALVSTTPLPLTMSSAVQAVDGSSFVSLYNLSGGSAAISLKGGWPNTTAPYKKNLSFNYTDRYSRALDTSKQAIVLGDRVIDGGYVATTPQIPILILHQPPGDQSKAFWEQTKSTSTAMSISVAKNKSTDDYVEVKLGASFSTGLGVEITSSVWATEGFGWNTTSTRNENNEVVITNTSNTQYETDPEGGDVFVGAQMNISITNTEKIQYDANGQAGCALEKVSSIAAAPESYESGFVYTESLIRNTIMPGLQALANDPSASQHSRDTALSSLNTWQQILDNNDANKERAIFIQNRSVNATYGFSSSYAKEETNTIDVNVESSETISLGAGVDIGGVGASYAGSIALRITTGDSRSTSAATETTTGFIISDDERATGDNYAVDIKRDPVYGTFVFKTTGGQSSCPTEPNTIPFNSASLFVPDVVLEGTVSRANRVQNNIPIVGNTGGYSNPAIFKMQLGNTSVSPTTPTTNKYKIKVNQSSVISTGLDVKINNVSLLGNNGQNFAVVDISRVSPFNSAEILVTVAKLIGNANSSFSNIKFEVWDDCESEILDTAVITANFVNPCATNINLTSPNNNFVVNSASNNTLPISFTGYNTSNLQFVTIQYAKTGTPFWVDGTTLFPNQQILSGSTNTTYNWDVFGLADDTYDVRLKLTCGAGVELYSNLISGKIDTKAPLLFGNPKPTDGNYINGDEISFSYNENIDNSNLNTNTISMYKKVGSIITPINVGVSGYQNKIVVVPTGALVLGDTIRVVATNVRDIYGNTSTIKDTLNFIVGRSVAGTSRTITIANTLLNGLPKRAIFESAGDNMKVVFTMGNIATTNTKPTTVRFAVSGTAVYGTDYTVTNTSPLSTFNNSIGTILIDSLFNSATLTINPIADGLFEPNESIIISLLSGGDYTLGTTGIALYDTIKNDNLSTPLITASGTACNRILTTATVANASYQWKLVGSTAILSTTASFTPTVAGSYTVSVYVGTQYSTSAAYVYSRAATTTSTTNTSICSYQLPYAWNGQSYTTGGTYSVTLVNSTGCGDSVATLVLTVQSSTSLAAITTLTQTLVSNVCGARVYRYTATPVSGATSYTWTLPTSVGGVSGVIVDTAVSNGSTIKLNYASNLAALTTDSIKVVAVSGCVSSAVKSAKLINTLISAPAVPATITITPIAIDSCGKKKYRYSAPALPIATTTAVAATGYVWQFLGTLGANARIDSGSLTSQTFRVSYTSDVASAIGDSIKLSYTSSCGNSVAKAAKLTNTLLTAPAAPTVTVTPISVNTCGARRYRYSASALPAATATAAAASGWSWSNPEGTVGSTGTRDSGTATSQTITVTYTSNAAAVAGDTIRVAFTSACGLGTSKATKLTNTALPVPAAPTVTVAAVTTNDCGARIYRYSASALPLATATTPAGTSWSWSLPEGSLTGTLDSGILTGQIIRIRYTSNAAAVAGDTIRVAFNSACGLGASKATKLTNTVLNPPAAPTVTVAAITTNVCGARIYRYSASALPIATATAGAATGWSWSLPEGPNGATGTLDSGVLGGQVIKIRYTSNAAAVAGDTIRVRFNSGCGLGTVKATKLTNTVLTAPLAPATVTIALVSNVCGVRVYRYTAPVLPVATTTAGAATGYAWSLPTGPVGATGTLDSGVLVGTGARYIKIRYSSNLAASAGDSIKVAYQSTCGNGATKAQYLSNLLLTCVAPTPVITKVETNASLPMSVIVYPNPTAKSFNLMVKTASSNQNATAKVYDLQGRVIKTLVVSTNTAVNFGNDLKAGVYFVEVKEGENTKTVRVVKY